MTRCIELAKLGLGSAAPNPLVGSVIVYKGKIIGEGYHQKCGEAHAEVNAINSVKDKSLLSKSTIYVNLEPCAHHGKTPPCADLIVENKIPRVVIACIDIFAKVSGKGIEKLKKGGCDVTLGVLEKESLELNRRFFTFHSKKRPYIILKWAETLDGFIDKYRSSSDPIEPIWITNSLSKILVHKWRTEETAFMIGTNTAMFDNPQLTVREWNGRNPVRIVLDKKLRLKNTLKIFDSAATTFIFNEQKDEIKENLHFIKTNFTDNSLKEILNILYQKEIQSVVVEGGKELLDSFIDQNLWDEARVFVGKVKFGNGVMAPFFNYIADKEVFINESKLMFYRNEFDK
ncbi:MAG: bifunctional diaminohydroxyphosphoribosylaminopyrimidine deaminase/5-amino-6-(5-phosphoribosylamino)uracil reductase RibD [Bacteroidales bacterium]|nr:bifunctional diaminohydroxyphosphoribosylaminopyrimidine deaminase/5-amino-6-(5-phosphoribosylamino)uracil reductase RibD [Bacteroidales bacterium]MBN2758632.1 bifunctional diaminohydroxyphosphoribosylaminopyrimidine deaminase/5-amino-6-(5-phosphoribosylamino)uracil reductase RibD [Bacteroidales bacterium]